MYAVKLTCRKTSSEGTVLCEEDTIVWIRKSRLGLTSSLFKGADLLVFDTKEEAEKLASEWVEDPWYHIPKKREVVEVKPRYRQVVEGYDEVLNG